MKMFSFVLLALLLVQYSISTASAQSCGSIFRNASIHSASYLTSPNYPSNYQSSSTCQWTITAPPGYVVELTFITFDTEGTSSFPYGCLALSNDILEVYNGRYVSSSLLLGRYCGKYLPANVYSSGTSLLLKFESGIILTRTGFKLKFKAVVPKPDPTICSPFNTKDQNNAIKYSGSSGYIKSPLYGTKYPSNIQCTWVITVPDGKKVKLSFQDFEVENPLFCSVYFYSSDYLEIRDGQYINSTSLKKLCRRTDIPSPFYSTGRYMWIRFKSNSDNYATTANKAQFSASFIAGPVPLPTTGFVTVPVTPSTSSSGKSTSSVTVGIVVGVVIGVISVISLVAICVCIDKRKRSPGNVNVPSPTTQNTAAATTRYPQQVGDGSVIHPQVGYSQAPHGSYPLPPQGNYMPPPAGSFLHPTGSYQPAPGSYPPPPTGSGTPAPVVYPPQSSIPMNVYPSQTISNDPAPPYPWPLPYPSQAATQQQAAPANPYLPPQKAPADPNAPYPPSQGAE